MITLDFSVYILYLVFGVRDTRTIIQKDTELVSVYECLSVFALDLNSFNYRLCFLVLLLPLLPLTTIPIPSFQLIKAIYYVLYANDTQQIHDNDMKCCRFDLEKNIYI